MQRESEQRYQAASSEARRPSPMDVARRAELSRYLPPGAFPDDREGLLAGLRRTEAPDSVIDTVAKLPEGPQFRTLGEVIRAIGTRSVKS